MAAQAGTDFLTLPSRTQRALRAVLCLLAAAAAGAAETRLSLQQAQLRSGPDFTPAYENREVVVQGQVSARPLWVIDSFYLPIQDTDGYGLILLGTAQQFENLPPGEWVEARGTISKRSGMPVLLPDTIRPLRLGPAPAPKRLRTADVAGFRYISVLVTVESEIAETGENGGGDVLSIGEQGKFVTVFLPKTRREAIFGLGGFNAGDRVRVIGIATQDCPLPA
jgi:hypothetical protein